MRRTRRQQFSGMLTIFASMRILLPFIFILATACSEKNKTAAVSEQTHKFSIPRIFQYDNNFKDSLTFFKSENINDAFTFFIDKFQFSDTVSIDNSGERDLTFGTDYITGDSASLKKLRDSLTSDGLQLIPDYSMSIPVNWSSISKSGFYYPIYVVNETNSDKLFTARDRYVSAIQEAKDQKEIWRPVESKRFDFTGNGRWALIIHPHEFALFLTAKYEGPFKTMLRVRMRIGDVTYLSKAFAGTINEKQFFLKRDSYQYNEFKKDISVSITRRFLGSIPLEPLD